MADLGCTACPAALGLCSIPWLPQMRLARRGACVSSSPLLGPSPTSTCPPMPSPIPQCSFSMGGMVAQMIAVNHPDAVRAVVSVASSYGSKAAPQPAGGIDAMLQ